MQKSLIRKGLVLGIIVLFIGASAVPLIGGTNAEKHNSIDDSTSFMGFNSRGDILYVGGSGPGNYSKIQDAIENASDGDTVFVYDDSSPYYENVVVNKSITLVGEDKETTIIDGGGIGDVIFVYAAYVNIENFRIINGGSLFWDASIYVGGFSGVYQVKISNNYISGSENGILTDSKLVAITENIITHCEIGIFLHSECSDSIIDSNVIQDNAKGLFLYEVKRTRISKNNIFDTVYFVGNLFGAFPLFNKWNRNYWRETLIFPKLIPGRIITYQMGHEERSIPWINADWHPAKEPYDIPRVAI